jgi:carbonic anhydrase
MKHTCRAIAISCIDFRVQQAVRAHLASTGYDGDYDLLSVAGGAMGLAMSSPQAVRDFLMEQIRISSGLHQTSEVLFFPHEDCGAYGGAAAYASRQEEFARQLSDIDEAKREIASRFPGYEFRVSYVVISGDGFTVMEGIPEAERVAH